MTPIRILAIDSSSGPASAAVVENGTILSEFFLNTGLTHSQTLMPMVQAVLQMSNTRTPDAIAVSAGPGSFTGVRIGIACAKGLAMAEDIPCVGISSLEVLAYNMAHHMNDGTLCVLMDARCEQAYCAFFALKSGEITRLTDDKCLAVTEIIAEAQAFSGILYLLGDCAETYWKDFAHAQLVQENNRYLRASSAAAAAVKKKWETAAQLQPIYLQLPQAQRELKKRLAADKETTYEKGTTTC